MWNNDDGEVSENGEPVKLYLPVQAPPRKTNTSPPESHIGGHFFLENVTPSCDVCQQPMYLMVQLRLQADTDTIRYVCTFACPREDCFRQLQFDKGFSSGGQGLVKCIERSVPKEDSKEKAVAPPAPTPTAPEKSSWYADDNDWGMDADDTAADTSALEKAVAAMEDNLDANGALALSNKASNKTANDKKSATSKNEALQNGFGCFILKEDIEPMATRPMLEEDDVGMGESDEKIRNMLARYMAEEEDEDILAALRGTEMGGGGGKGEEDERLSEEDRILRGFQDRLRRTPRQVVRYARGGMPLWSVPDKNRKSGKQLWNVPNCQCCGGPQTFEFQLLPSVLGILEVDKFSKRQGKGVNDKVALDDLLSDGMNFGSIAVFTCANSACTEECKEASVVIQKSVDDLPERKQAAENDFPSATMAVVEDLDDDDEFTPDG